ncbi:MAG: peptidylprolyl isomerase [Blastochloris sp.]|nr:peptidylprolyl isomerase [Blastochloris sp.]
MSANPSEAGCTVKPVITAKPKTVSVNGVTISRAAIARETQNHPATKPIEAWQQAARALVVRELLLQEARAIALEPEPLKDNDGKRETDDEALVRQLIASEVRTPKADAASARRYYEQNRRRFRSGNLFEVRHILLPAAPGDVAARKEARAHADTLITLLRADASQFGDVAKMASACPSREVGGNLGQIGPGQTVPEFEAALASMPVGEVAPEAIESRYGFHVVMVGQRIEGRELPFEMVETRITDWLDEKVRRTAIQQYIGILAGKAEITGVDITAHTSPLVQ